MIVDDELFSIYVDLNFGHVLIWTQRIQDCLSEHKRSQS